MKSLPPPAGTLDHRQDGQAALVAATPPALPAFCKLSADLFTAALTSPRPFDRRQRRERPFQDGFSFGFSIVIDDPKLGPAFDERQFAGGNCEIEFPGYALDAIGFHNILEVGNHQRIFCAVNFFHTRLLIVSRAAGHSRSASISRPAIASAQDDRHSRHRLMGEREPTSLRGGA
jgi:hypothetical protein